MADKLFTYGVANVDSLLATTLSSVQKTLADNIFTRYPLLNWFKSNKVSLGGGASIVVPLMYDVNSTAKQYNAYDLLDTTPLISWGV